MKMAMLHMRKQIKKCAILGCNICCKRAQLFNAPVCHTLYLYHVDFTITFDSPSTKDTINVQAGNQLIELKLMNNQYHQLDNSSITISKDVVFKDAINMQCNGGFFTVNVDELMKKQKPSKRLWSSSTHQLEVPIWKEKKEVGSASVTLTLKFCDFCNIAKRTYFSY